MNNPFEMSTCKHQWQSVSDMPLYRCIHCGLYMRVEK